MSVELATDKATEMAYGVLEKLLENTGEEFVPHSIVTVDGKVKLTVPNWLSLAPISDDGYDFKLNETTVDITFTVQ